MACIMRNILIFLSFTFLFFVSSATAKEKNEEQNTIIIGVNLGISGSLATPTADIMNGINLAYSKVEEKGGITIADKKYAIKIITYDNKGDISTGSQLAMHGITKDRIHALIMPLFSDIAVQVAQVVNGYKTPAVCVNTTSPKITKNRSYIFRTSASYAEMARATEELASKTWAAKKIGILYDEFNGYSSDMAQAVLHEFTKKHGPQSIAIVKTFKSGTTDFHQQLTEIIKAEPDFLYVPQYIDEVSEIVKQSRGMGWEKPITGPNTWGLWGAAPLMEKCGDLCKNLFYTANFVAKGADGEMEKFASAYHKKYNKTATSNAAYGYESFNIIIEALERMETFTGKLQIDRIALRDAISKTNYSGATGKIFYQGSGEPIKCPIVAKIDKNGEFVQHFISCANN